MHRTEWWWRTTTRGASEDLYYLVLVVRNDAPHEKSLSPHLPNRKPRDQVENSEYLLVSVSNLPRGAALSPVHHHVVFPVGGFAIVEYR